MLRPIEPYGAMCAKVKYVAVTKLQRVIIPLVIQSVLEGDKSEKVAKTNVWVMIKRNEKYLQGFEDNSKKNSLSSNKDF